jgi:hypothetical protein
VLSIQEIKQRHAKEASITGAPPLIEIETSESVAARKAAIRQNDKDHDEHIEAGIEEPFIPTPLPAQEFLVYARVVDEPPRLENRIVERGEVKFLDGAFKVVYTSRALTTKEQEKLAKDKDEQDKAGKLNRLVTPLLTADTILLVHRLATDAQIDIPDSIVDFVEKYA